MLEAAAGVKHECKSRQPLRQRAVHQAARPFLLSVIASRLSSAGLLFACRNLATPHYFTEVACDFFTFLLPIAKRLGIVRPHQMNYLNIAHSITQKIERLESGAGLIPAWARKENIARLHRVLVRVRSKSPTPTAPVKLVQPDLLDMGAFQLA